MHFLNTDRLQQNHLCESGEESAVAPIGKVRAGYKVVDVEYNYVGDGLCLTEGCFPQVKTLALYGQKEKDNQFTTQGFVAKM